MFPNSPAVWIVLILAVAIVVIWAIVKGRSLKISSGKVNLNLAPSDPVTAKIDVASGLDASGGKIGNVSGVKAEAGSRFPTAHEINVLKQARLKNVEVGDITGVDLSDKVDSSERNR